MISTMAKATIFVGVIMLGAACKKDDGKTLAHNGRMAMNLVYEEGQISVDVINNSEAVIVIDPAPKTRNELTNSAVFIDVRRGEKLLQPCASVDPPREKASSVTLGPGKSTILKMRLGYLKSVFCLDAGRYSLQAVYPRDGENPVLSNEINVQVE